MQQSLTLLAVLTAVTGSCLGEIEPKAHFNLKGQGGIRDTAAPPVWKNLVQDAPDLARQGSPKIMSNGPESRRSEYDSSIQFLEPDQCYNLGKNLVSGDNFVVEVWAYALKDNDGGWHAVVANGDGGSGFLLGQNGDQWAVLVGGVGGTNLGKVEPNKWTHLAIVKSAGTTTGWLNGAKVTELPGLGGGKPNFSIGATSPNKEAFHGWIAEVRHATFKPGRFDPTADFLMDTEKLKVVQAAAKAKHARFINALGATPGLATVKALDERPYGQDWLITPPSLKSNVQFEADADRQSARIMLANGLVSRTFLVKDGNLGCIGMRRSDKDIEFVRAIKPEARINIDGTWHEIGGLKGAPDKAFLTPEWLERFSSRDGAFVLIGMTVGGCVKPYEWKPKCNAPQDIAWPAKGQRVTFHFAPPPNKTHLAGVTVDVHYEIYDGIPVIMKSLTLHNKRDKELTVTKFESEHLAVLPSNSRMMHVESDYSFAMANATDKGSGLGIHVSGGKPEFYDYSFGGGTTRFIRDPDWGSMATLNQAEDLFLNDPQNALLLSRPTVGPDWTVKPGESFNSFRTFEILNDTTEKERFHLAQRRFYRKLAPQTNEKQMEVHAPVTRDMKVLAPLIDQMKELGFEMLQAPEHPGGFNYADPSDGNVNPMKAITDYATPMGIRVKAYQLMMASQGWGSPGDKYNCISPATGKPGSLFGQSACGASAWADMYYTNMWQTIERAGMGGFAPDGPYHGDPCAAKDHPHHKGLEDSQWAQWKWMCSVLHEGQRRNLYLTVPDWYFLNGQVCTGMGYREATDNIDIVLQTVIYRQYIFDATFHKTAQMGWCNLNTEVLRGGLDANVDKYERMLFTLLSSGAQVWVRGHKLYDGPQSKAMLTKWMAWYKKYFDIIHGDIIHLKRPDGRDMDYYLHVNPTNKHKGMLLVFNPLGTEITRTITLPLYYTGLTGSAKIRQEEGTAKTIQLDGMANTTLAVTLPPGGFSWFIVE
jgi:hypothetical protein